VTGRPVAVVVPAWDEEESIGACLAALLDQQVDAPLTVVVAANGCRDRTAAVARGYAALAEQRGHTLAVTEVADRSKPGALNAGDALCPPGSHRLYLDADARLSPGALAALAAAFESGVDLASPRLDLDLARAPAVCRPYWRCWAALPTVSGQVLGGGAYGVSARGRARWTTFPDLVADDLYARSRFGAAEGRVLDGVTFTTAAPPTLAGTLRALTRWRRGNRQLAAAATAPATPVPQAPFRQAVAAARTDAGATVVDLAAFVLVTGVVRVLAAAPGGRSTWARGR
jgi:hypothetical protein